MDVRGAECRSFACAPHEKYGAMELNTWSYGGREPKSSAGVRVISRTRTGGQCHRKPSAFRAASRTKVFHVLTFVALPGGGSELTVEERGYATAEAVEMSEAGLLQTPRQADRGVGVMTPKPNGSMPPSSARGRTRRAILARLAQGEASVAELGEPFGMTRAAVSKHLMVLERRPSCPPPGMPSEDRAHTCRSVERSDYDVVESVSSVLGGQLCATPCLEEQKLAPQPRRKRARKIAR